MSHTFLAKTMAVRVALAKCASVDEVKEIRDKAEAMRAYAKQVGYGLEMQNSAAEIKIRAGRRGGELLKVMKDRGERTKSRKQESHDVTLDDLGISKMQSSRWQTIAKIP